VRIITGDTKVVERGKCDKLFITTSGVGIMRPGMNHIGSAERVRDGDKLIVNGSLGNHSIAVLGARKELPFSTPVMSDCAALNKLIENILDVTDEVHFMRDLTRGGLASVLNELLHMIKQGIIINESEVPVDESVSGLCEMFGFDPFYLANEGKVLVVVSNSICNRVLDAMRANPLGLNSRVIGEIRPDDGRQVIVNTITGGHRILDLPSGIQLPRIC
jgi:hydrogenase expression/formation protein HypE